MEVKLLKENLSQNQAEKWDQFVLENSSPAVFLQSSKWASFSQKTQKNSLLVCLVEEKEIKTQAVFTIKKLPLGQHYLSCAKGPIFNKKNSLKENEKILYLLKNKVGRKHKSVMLRIAPPYSEKKIEGSLKKQGFKKPKILTNLKEPEKTFLIDLKKPEEQILQEMHQKTRYNIRLAQKKGIKIRLSNNPEKEIDCFYKLMQETAKRDRINIYSKKYYKDLLVFFKEKRDSKTGFSQLWLAEYEGKILSAIITFAFGKSVTYFYGASTSNKRNLMPNYLLQWEIIKNAKKGGYKIYDFWGIDEDNAKWQGITKFKKSFNKKEPLQIEHIGTYDFIIKKSWHKIFIIAKHIQKIYGK